MKRYRKPLLGIALFTVSLLGINLSSRVAVGGMMGHMMMDGRGMNSQMGPAMGGRNSQGVDPRDLPDPQSKGARLLNQYCTQCHNLPDPHLHIASEWPRVLERMTQKIKTFHKNMPDKKSREEILAYLQGHAR